MRYFQGTSKIMSTGLIIKNIENIIVPSRQNIYILYICVHGRDEHKKKKTRTIHRLK